MPPSGRIKKPAPNVMKASINWAKSLPVGKKAFPIALA
jgi:hypothetical protein